MCSLVGLLLKKGGNSIFFNTILFNTRLCPFSFFRDRHPIGRMNMAGMNMPAYVNGKKNSMPPSRVVLHRSIDVERKLKEYQERNSAKISLKKAVVVKFDASISQEKLMKIESKRNVIKKEETKPKEETKSFQSTIAIKTEESAVFPSTSQQNFVDDSDNSDQKKTIAELRNHLSVLKQQTDEMINSSNALSRPSNPVSMPNFFNAFPALGMNASQPSTSMNFNADVVSHSHSSRQYSPLDPSVLAVKIRESCQALNLELKPIAAAPTGCANQNPKSDLCDVKPNVSHPSMKVNSSDDAFGAVNPNLQPVNLANSNDVANQANLSTECEKKARLMLLGLLASNLERSQTKNVAQSSTVDSIIGPLVTSTSSVMEQVNVNTHSGAISTDTVVPMSLQDEPCTIVKVESHADSDRDFECNLCGRMYPCHELWREHAKESHVHPDMRDRIKYDFYTVLPKWR